MKLRLLLLAACLFVATAIAQFRPPKLPANPAGYIVIDSINPSAGRLALALDANGDGGLSRAEIANASVALGRLDRNEDGQLDSAETGKQGALEVQGQRSGFLLSYGLKHSECHDLKQALGIPKIITMRVMHEQAFYADLDKGFSSTINVQLIGTSAYLVEVQPFEMAHGRILSPWDGAGFLPVAVLGADVARKLLPAGNPIGKIVKLKTEFFYVIGVLKNAGPRPMAVYIPEATMSSRFGYRSFKRQSGGISAAEWEITKAWIPVQDARRADFLLRAISRRLDPKQERADLKIKYVPTK
jgi:hypothetical protein